MKSHSVSLLVLTLMSSTMTGVPSIGHALQGATVDSGEPCPAIVERNRHVSWGAYTPLPLRCVPMKNRVTKVYPIGHIPRGMSCLNDIYRDRDGNAGLVCGPVIRVLTIKRDEICDAGDADVEPGWRDKYCRGAGTGLIQCDDGKTAVDLSAQEEHCDVTVYEHVK